MTVSALNLPLPKGYTSLFDTPKPLDLLDHHDLDLLEEEDPPLESDWHVAAMTLLIDILRDYWTGHDDIYVSGNTVVHFDPLQRKGRKFRGPDLYVVKGVTDKGFRTSWTLWEEHNLSPNFILELASKSTAKFDVAEKKDIYERELRTSEYVVYNPHTEQLQGWRLRKGRYVSISPNADGWLWCQELGLWIGLSEYKFLKDRGAMTTPRFFDQHGQLVPTREEAQALQLKQVQAKVQAEAQALRAAEAEIARLKTLLTQLK